MSTVVDMLPYGNNLISATTDDKLPIDLLNRQEIIWQIMQLLNIISDSKSSCTFALNGAWGTGKTFVLNRLMRSLLDYQDGEKFFVFHYNCWQYDYYEEPLIAIIAAMLDSVDQENHLFSKGIRDKTRQGMEVAKPVIEKIAQHLIKQKIGVDITDMTAFVKDRTNALNALKAEDEAIQDFDLFYSFKKAITSAKRHLANLRKIGQL